MRRDFGVAVKFTFHTNEAVVFTEESSLRGLEAM